MKTFTAAKKFQEIRLKMEQELDQIYKCLEGKQFRATYKGEFGMATGNERSVLKIENSDMKKVLAKIRQQVKESDELANKKVWKAITGPEDGYDEYRLYVNLEEDLEEEASYFFSVTGVTPFSELKWQVPYDAGMDIQVKIAE